MRVRMTESARARVRVGAGARVSARVRARVRARVGGVGGVIVPPHYGGEGRDGRVARGVVRRLVRVGRRVRD